MTYFTHYIAYSKAMGNVFVGDECGRCVDNRTPRKLGHCLLHLQ